MTKFTLKEIEENVNVSSQSPLKESLELLLKILVVVLVVYWLLGAAVDRFVPHLSVQTEQRISKLFMQKIAVEKEFEMQTEKLQKILNSMVSPVFSALPKLDYQIYIKKSETANAYAFPSGQIVLLTGLLKEVESENELVMILGHEMGHYANRDHLRGLGRRIIAILFLSFLGFSDSNIEKLFSNFISGVEMKFSQRQEQAADIFGLELLNKIYAHVGGATDFFERINEKEKSQKFLYFLASHPHPERRVLEMKNLINKNGYKIEVTKPFEKSEFNL